MKTVIFLILLTGIVSCTKVEQTTQTNVFGSETQDRFSWKYVESSEGQVDFVVTVEDYNPGKEKVLYLIEPTTVRKHPFDDCFEAESGEARKTLEKGVQYGVIVHIFAGDSLKGSLSKYAHYAE